MRPHIVNLELEDLPVSHTNIEKYIVELENTNKESLIKWIKCDAWKDLPVGTWLVRIAKEKSPYHIAEVILNEQKDKIVIVGGSFYFDMGELLAYTDFERYEDV